MSLTIPLERSSLQSKCVPVLLYGLEACALNKSQIGSLDFACHKSFFYEIVQDK